MAKHHPIPEINISPQADKNSSSAPLAESVDKPAPILEDVTIASPDRSSQSTEDVESADSANIDERCIIGPADSHAVSRRSSSPEIEDHGAPDSPRNSMTSTISFDGAHYRPHGSVSMEIEEIPVGVKADSTPKTVKPIATSAPPIRDADFQAIEEDNGKTIQGKSERASHEATSITCPTSGVLSNEELLRQQITLLSKIDSQLREMNNRQAAADVSRQALQSVPEHSSSAWNPLLRSARERIDAIVDRWRGSLDVLLVFVGLFSAIVTSFFVDSVHNLSPDQAARTNELLANLTEIVIQISGIQAALLNITPSTPFVPAASDVRVNAYWSLALIISISAAALAVAGRAFLAVLTKSTGKPHEMLVDIHQRWAEAERILGPALEILPAILTIPVVLFLIGLLDNIFSAAMSSPRTSAPVIVAASLSATVLLLVGVVLFYTLVHANLHPETSPFRTTISRYIHTSSQRIKRQFPRLFRWIKKHVHSSVKRISVLGRKLRYQAQSSAQWISPRIRSAFHPWKPDVESQSPETENEENTKENEEEKEETEEEEEDNEEEEEEENEEGEEENKENCLPSADCAYHATLQVTHDDDFLDQAAAAFLPICENKTTRENFYYLHRSTTILSDLEIKSLVHLLSPEASYRCNLTASKSILRLNRSLPEHDELIFCGTFQRLKLLDALRDAAQREHSRFKDVGRLWRSTFIQSFAVLSHRRRQTDNQPDDQPDLSRIVNMLNSEYIEETEGDGNVIGQRVSEMAFSVLYDAALQEHRSAETTPKSNAVVFVDYLANLLGPSSSIAPLTFTKCLSRWTGRDVFSYIPINWNDTISSLAPRIWAGRTLTLKHVLTLLSWGVRCGLGSLKPEFEGSLWARVLENLTTIMETERQPTWPYFGTIPSLEQNDGHPLLKGMIPRLGAYVRLEGRPYYRRVSNKTAITCAFSAIFEILSWQLDNPLIGDQLNPLRVDKALIHILGPSPPNSFSPVDVTACLAFWDGTNIFTRMSESDLEPESKNLKCRKILVDAMIRWLWKEVPDRDIPKHVNRLTILLDDKYGYRFIVDALMSLFHLENSRTRKLNIAFSVLDRLIIQSIYDPLLLLHIQTDDLIDQIDTHRNFYPLTSGLVKLIATHTHETHGSLSREQAKLLVSIYDRIRALLWSHDWNEGLEVEKTRFLELFRTLWKDLYPRGSIGSERQLLLEPKSNTSNLLQYLGDWSCLRSASA